MKDLCGNRMEQTVRPTASFKLSGQVPEGLFSSNQPAVSKSREVIIGLAYAHVFGEIHQAVSHEFI
jgi:hypothetical protein